MAKGDIYDDIGDGYLKKRDKKDDGSMLIIFIALAILVLVTILLPLVFLVCSFIWKRQKVLFLSLSVLSCFYLVLDIENTWFISSLAMSDWKSDSIAKLMIFNISISLISVVWLVVEFVTNRNRKKSELTDGSVDGVRKRKFNISMIFWIGLAIILAIEFTQYLFD